jgi:restriction system protein
MEIGERDVMARDEHDFLSQPLDSAMPALIEHWRQRRQPMTHDLAVTLNASITFTATLHAPSIVQLPPDVLLQAAIISLGGETAEGQLVVGVSVAWFEVISQLERDPAFLTKVHWRQLEELIAGAYEREGWPEVVLTPRSGDGGRDVIASKPGIGSIRILDQVKAYGSHRMVPADDVRAMLGVLEAEQNVSKGLVTTTSGFAPGIREDRRLQAFMPYRLELKDGPQLRDWLLGIAKARKP